MPDLGEKRDEVQIQVRVPVALHDAVKCAAKDADLSLAQVARRALVLWLKEQSGRA